MRRKVKLITTIASLTAAIALLMFGVYAAANRTVNVSGTVSFEATRLNVSVSVYEANATTIVDDVASQVGTTTNLQDVTETTTFNLGSVAELSLSDVTGAENQTYSYLVKFVSFYTSTTSKVTITYTAPTGQPDWITHTSISAVSPTAPAAAVTNAATDLDLNSGETVYYLLTFTIDTAKAPLSGTYEVSSSYVLALTNI